MNNTQPLSVRETIAREIQSALVGHAPLTSAELAERCTSAEDSSAVSRVIYDLRQSRFIEKAGERHNGKPGRGAQPANTWRWIGPADAAPKVTRAKKPRVSAVEATTPEQVPVSAVEDVPQPLGDDERWSLADAIADDIRRREPEDVPLDVTRSMIVAELVDHMDDAVLEYADAALRADPVWMQLRAMQQGAVSALRQAMGREDGHD